METFKGKSCEILKKQETSTLVRIQGSLGYMDGKATMFVETNDIIEFAKKHLGVGDISI